MPIRIVKVPPDIKLHDPATGEPLEREKRPERKDDKDNTIMTWTDFVQHLLSHPQYIKSRDAIKIAASIEGSFSEDVCGQDVELSSTDWDTLILAIEEPKSVTIRGPVEGFPWQPWVMRQMLPFLDAIADAEEKKHAKAEPPAEQKPAAEMTSPAAEAKAAE